LTNLHTKINIDHGEFKKETSTATDKIVKIVDSRWEQIKKNAEIFKNHYADMSKVKVSRVLRKNFLSERQKFSSIYEHAICAQYALRDVRQIVDASFLHKTNIANISRSENKSQLQENAIAQQNESQGPVKLPLISNIKKITTSNINDKKILDKQKNYVLF
jgi:hypothetical protein